MSEALNKKVLFLNKTWHFKKKNSNILKMQEKNRKIS